MTTADTQGSTDTDPHHPRWRRIRFRDIILILFAVYTVYRVGVFVGQLTAGDIHVTYTCSRSPANATSTMTVHPGTQDGFACG